MAHPRMRSTVKREALGAEDFPTRFSGNICILLKDNKTNVEIQGCMVLLFSGVSLKTSWYFYFQSSIHIAKELMKLSRV